MRICSGPKKKNGRSSAIAIAIQIAPASKPSSRLGCAQRLRWMYPNSVAENAIATDISVSNRAVSGGTTGKIAMPRTNGSAQTAMPSRRIRTNLRMCQSLFDSRVSLWTPRAGQA